MRNFLHQLFDSVDGKLFGWCSTRADKGGKERRRRGVQIIHFDSFVFQVMQLNISNFRNQKVNCSHASGPLSYQFWDLFVTSAVICNSRISCIPSIHCLFLMINETHVLYRNSDIAVFIRQLQHNSSHTIAVTMYLF